MCRQDEVAGIALLASRSEFTHPWQGKLPLFIYFYINRVYIYYFIYDNSSSATLDLLIASAWGDEPRFELGPAVQQADALLSKTRRTLSKPRRTLSKPRRTLSKPRRTL